ncbi:glutathione S-transferase family protein [Grimontia sp. NTOU-MAR1]|uniref:glutathione S-transferase family protein n=1 Tax=Grimontia sp. NTOU-MAR1 TaxID=3111011 RepID=UPI002DB89201|nr:glutathione S-transferase family protein [Grimontia sp. NTOU-MAR1]WRV98411.1 glutathione S-transferase family protein [Grimontia sp. NTOU-MAR1]WRV98539.1 glutathione S-transferase family protein [Grimontia sp. NTOU-MAR1]
MLKLYEFALSGNCYKVRLILSFLEMEYQRIAIEITKGESRTAEFLSINSNGKVPVLEIQDDNFLTESNAILWYLATDTFLLPSSRLKQAEILKWLSFEQSGHQPFLAGPRYWISILNAKEEYETQLNEKRPKGYAALDVMEKHLQNNDFFVGDNLSIADISLYAYTHVAHEGEYNLSKYTAINHWIKRVEGTNNYITITQV